MKPWIITAAILTIAIALGLWQLNSVQVIEAVQPPSDPANAMLGTVNSRQLSGRSNVNSGTTANIQGSATPSTNTPQKPLTGNAHFDQMSPAMQQALKESLLLENPTTTIDGANGAVILPSQGKFTQMPVAVQMPDGTIQIREYSEIPRIK